MSLNWAIWSAVGIALGAAYLIWLFQRTMLGEISEKNAKLLDLSWREIAVFAPLIVWAFWIGLYPKPFFQVLERPAAAIVERVQTGQIASPDLPNTGENRKARVTKDVSFRVEVSGPRPAAAAAAASAPDK